MKVKLGFIGTGGMAGAHMRNLQTFDDIEFTAMCDVSEERAEGCAEEFGGNAYTDFREMYDEESLDAVISAPRPLHTANRSELRVNKASRCSSRSRSLRN